MYSVRRIYIVSSKVHLNRLEFRENPGESFYESTMAIFFYLLAFSNYVFTFASYASERTRKVREREKEEAKKEAARARETEKERSPCGACSVLYSAIRYERPAAWADVSAQLSWARTHVFHLDTARSSSAVAQLRFQMTSFSPGSPVVAGSKLRGIPSNGWSSVVRALADQSAS